MSYELIIAEKPSAAKKIAESLADKKPKATKVGKVKYYKITHEKKDIIVCSAVGHLFGLKEKDKKGWTYPTFSYEWQPTFIIDKKAGYTKEYYDVLVKLVKDAKKFTVATDYDAEGEVIGYNIIKYIAKKKDAKRMKFSTMTKDELRESYQKAQKHLDHAQAQAGLTRHQLDWLWGINLSRALTLSIKNATNRFKILSTGRVQGPALHLLAEKEKEIQKFKPTLYWELPTTGVVRKTAIEAEHKKGKFTDKKQAQKIYKKVQGKNGEVTQIKATNKKIPPPHPFDLTSLQIEAYRVGGITPKKTLEYAQSLYSDGYISYPRTSSQKLPASINYKKILKKLAKQFPKEAEFVLNTKLQPNEGKKQDAAHPAIYPTGNVPAKKVQGQEKKVYELIVRRFFATFGQAATRQTITITIDIAKEPFITKGTRTIEQGWYDLYSKKFTKATEEELPKVEKGDKVTKIKVKLEEKETQPPRRYSEASIIKALEKENLGTKSTRANVIQNLYDRSYIEGKSIKVTDLGMTTVKTLNKYCPEILDEELTRDFEVDMEKIIEEKRKPENILKNAEKFLKKTLKNFKEHETKIGKVLGKSHQETQEKQSYLGPCPVCKKADLQIRRGRFGFFAACKGYPKCETTASLPKARIESLRKACESCKWPMVKIIKAKSRPFDTCLNLKCKTKEVDKKIAKQKKFCPKCESQLVLRKTLNGAFWACPGFPKCRHIEAIDKPKAKA